MATKTRFLTIFDPRSSIVKSVLDCAYPVCTMYMYSSELKDLELDESSL